MSNRTPLHDYRRSKAVLIGTSSYAHLAPLPAAANSLQRMTRLLTSDLCGWPQDRVSVFSDESGPGDLPDRLITTFEEARDVALFYFVGHGLVDVEDQLCLGLVGSRTEPHRRASTSLQFHSVRRAMLGSPATTKIIVLDCCFAGLANRPSNTLGTYADLLDKTAGTGAYTMAACGSYSTAWYEKRAKKEPQTYFTKYLADLVQTGIPGEPATLRLRVLFRQLCENLASEHRPLPEDRNIDAASDFLFAHNAAFLPADTYSSLRALEGQQEQLEGLRVMMMGMSRRNQVLVQRQLALIDNLEKREEDTERLSELYKIDHYATRMRRTAENLIFLAGFDLPVPWNEPVALSGVLRAAASEIEHYNRVTLNVAPGIMVRGEAVNDVIHLVAELIENGTLFSPSHSQVIVSGRPFSGGEAVLEITDRGVGMRADRMARANWLLTNPPVEGLTVSRQMGLFIAAKYAAKHKIRIELYPGAEDRGVTAFVWLPEDILSREEGQELCSTD
jgi:signal transduction histidine kinase